MVIKYHNQTMILNKNHRIFLCLICYAGDSLAGWPIFGHISGFTAEGQYLFSILDYADKC